MYLPDGVWIADGGDDFDLEKCGWSGVAGGGPRSGVDARLLSILRCIFSYLTIAARAAG